LSREFNQYMREISDVIDGYNDDQALLGGETRVSTNSKYKSNTEMGNNSAINNAIKVAIARDLGVSEEKVKIAFHEIEEKKGVNRIKALSYNDLKNSVREYYNILT